MSISFRVASGSVVSMAGPLKKLNLGRVWLPSIQPSLTGGNFPSNLKFSTLTTKSSDSNSKGVISDQGSIRSLEIIRKDEQGLLEGQTPSVTGTMGVEGSMTRSPGSLGHQLIGPDRAVFSHSQTQVRLYSSSSREPPVGPTPEVGSVNGAAEAHVEQQQREHCFSAGRARDTVERLDAMAHISLSGMSSSYAQDMQGSMDAAPTNGGNNTGMPDYNASEQYDSSGSVSLHGVMQSNVPEPFSPNDRGNPTPMNMPGGGQVNQDKYVHGHIKDVHPSRQFSTSSQVRAQSSTNPRYTSPIHETDVQGIQGDDCARYRLWRENCNSFKFNCDEQIQGLQSGRKTLSEVIDEQERLSKQVVKDFENRKNTFFESPDIQGPTGDIGLDANDTVEKLTENRRDSFFEGPDIQGPTGDLELDANYTVEKLIHLENPCPQGIQGEDCDRFKLWLQNCTQYGFINCNENLQGLKKGRKTLGQIFAEQDQIIRSIVQQTRKYSTSAPGDKQQGRTSDAQVSKDTSELQLSQRARLKRAVRDYGATVVVFHVGISLVSLGTAYLAVSR